MPPAALSGTMRLCVPIAIVVTLLLPGCSTRGPARTKAGRELSPPASYVRVSNSASNVVQLQIALRQFIPARGPGPEVWLAGVVHVGESNYFAALQEHLDGQDLVLCEGISGSPEPDQSSPESGVVAASPKSSLQTSLAAALGLVFQLEALNYNRANFRNSDLSVEQLRHLLEEHPAAAEQEDATQNFERLLQMMEGGTLFDSLLQLGLRLVSASPKLQAIGRLALIEVINEIQGDPSQLRGLPKDVRQLLEVLIQERNQHVLADLRAQLRQIGPRGSVTVLYGAGHMPDLERRLRKALGYRPAKQIWLTAFAVDLGKAGISDADRQFISGLLQQAMAPYKTGD